MPLQSALTFLKAGGLASYPGRGACFIPGNSTPGRNKKDGGVRPRPSPKERPGTPHCRLAFWRITLLCDFWRFCVFDFERTVVIGCDACDTVPLQNQYNFFVITDAADPFVVQIADFVHRPSSVKKTGVERTDYTSALSTPIGPSPAPICRRIILCFFSLP